MRSVQAARSTETAKWRRARNSHSRTAPAVSGRTTSVMRASPNSPQPTNSAPSAPSIGPPRMRNRAKFPDRSRPCRVRTPASVIFSRHNLYDGRWLGTVRRSVDRTVPFALSFAVPQTLQGRSINRLVLSERVGALAPAFEEGVTPRRADVDNRRDDIASGGPAQCRGPEVRPFPSMWTGLSDSARAE